MHDSACLPACMQPLLWVLLSVRMGFYVSKCLPDDDDDASGIRGCLYCLTIYIC